MNKYEGITCMDNDSAIECPLCRGIYTHIKGSKGELTEKGFVVWIYYYCECCEGRWTQIQQTHKGQTFTELRMML